MSELSRKIVLAVASGDAHEAQVAFEAAAAELMISALESKRQDVARNMFKDVTAEVETDEVEDTPQE
jgi:hypothetical protein